MNYDLKVGFGRVDITPPLGVNVTGYFKDRIADGVLDNLELNCLAVNKNDKTVYLITVDNCEINRSYIELCKDAIIKETGADRESIFISCTHTHTGPILDDKFESDLLKNANDKDKEYSKYTIHKFPQVCKMAFEDLRPAYMGYAVSKAENIGFNRRYLMKDGSVKTNPGVNNPDIVKSIGLLDERVNVLRFVRDDGSNYVLANYGNHPDTIGGNKISGDWPSLTRRVFEKVMDNTKCIFFNGAEGDINHVNVHPQGGDLNNMILDFDDVSRGYAHAKHMANVVCGAIMSVYEKVKFTPVEEIKYSQKEFLIPSNKPKKEEIPEAHRINDLHNAGKDNELPYEGMMLTTIVAEAGRMVRLENAPDNFSMLFSAVKIGNIGFLGVPGEPFTGIGLGVKETEGYDLILPCCLTNASDGYFPMQDSYIEGGYEARSSIFKAGVAELMIDYGKKILKDLKG